MNIDKIIYWTTTETFVDIKTGEILTKHNAKKNYITIKKKKHATIHDQRGTITIENLCRKRPKQLTINFT